MDDLMSDMDMEVSPPSSPVLGYSGARDGQSLAGSSLVFYLSCKGQPKSFSSSDTSFSPNGLILRGQLLSAVESLRNDDCSDFSSDGFHLYSFFSYDDWDPSDLNQLQDLTALCSKHIACLDILSNPLTSMSMGDDDDVFDSMDPWTLRQDVCTFLNFIISRLSYFRKILNSRDKLDEYFLQLRNSLQRTADWPKTLQAHCGNKDGNECTSAMYHMFHLQLELRWFLLIIYGGDEEFLSYVVEDLIHLAHFKYPSENLHGSNAGGLLSKQPFNCWCVKEIWTMIRLLCEEIENRDFWSIFKAKLDRFLESNHEGIFFSFWLTVHIASLSEYSLLGAYCEVCPQNYKNNAYPFVLEILKKWISIGGKPSEMNLLATELINYWGFDLQVVLTFWNYWLPLIDKMPENSSTCNLDSFSNISKWEKLICALCASKSNGDSQNRRTSITIDNNSNQYQQLITSDGFLSFVKLLVNQARVVSKNTDWKKLKSRIGNNLDKNVVGKYGEIGILRISTIYLALAYSTNDTGSMFDRLTETLQFTKMTPARQKTIILAQATGIFLMLKKSIDIRSAAASTSLFMDTVNNLMSQSTLDSTKKDSVMIYLSLLDAIPYPCTPQFTDNTESLGRSSLISPNLTMWLFNCDPNYVIRTLRPLLKITEWIIHTKMRDPLSFSTERDGLSEKILDKVFSFLTQSAILSANRVSSTDLQPMADLAADLTVILILNAFTNSKTNSGPEIVKHFEHFALYERTSPEVSQFYIDRLISHYGSENITTAIPDIKWFQSWVRLNALNLKIPKELSVKQLGVDLSFMNNEEIMYRFCEIGSDEWSRNETTTILSPLVVLTKLAMGGNLFKETSGNNENESGASSYLKGIIRASSSVLQIFHYDKIYTKGDSNSMAFQLLSALIPPLVGTPPWEKLPKAVITELKQQLFPIFKSIVESTTFFHDQFLQRKVHDLVVIALLGYLGNINERLPENHPMVMICLYTAKYDLSIMDTIIIPQLADQLTSNDGKHLQRFIIAVTALRFKGLTSMVLRFLPSMLKVFVTNPQGLNAELQSATLNVIQYCCIFGTTIAALYKDIVITAFQNVFNSHFAFKSKRFFDLGGFLTKSAKSRVKIFLRKELLPLFRKHVSNCEGRRGSGVDYSLRTPLEKLERETTGFENLPLTDN